MGFFKEKYIVEFEYATSFISSYKKATMVVEATSEYSAKDNAKAVLNAQYKFVKILSARKSTGRNDERNVTFTPKVITSSSTTINTHRNSEAPLTTIHSEKRPLTPEEIEERARRREAMLVELEAREKQRKIATKEREIRNIKASPIKNLIITVIISLIATAIAWIPYLICKTSEKGYRGALADWIELGHSESDSYGQELISEINKAAEAGNSVLWIPFAVLAVGIVLVIIVFVLTKNKASAKVDKCNEELVKLKNS